MKSKNGLIALSILLIAALAACSPAAPAVTNSAPAAPVSPAPTYSAPSLQSPSLESLQQSYEQVYEKVLPSVVNIVVTEKASSTNRSIPNLPFDLPDDNQPQERQIALGSGFIWDDQGHIVTNNHVVEGAESIMVTFADGSTRRATLVGSDVDSDLAVIKVDASNKLVPIQIADSTQTKIGQIAIAIGQPAGLQGTMTVGIISGLGRSLRVDSTTRSGIGFSIPDIIQTDAPISPGNSGGPLVDIYGRLIGVNTAIESPSQGYTSIGYVVSSAIVQKVVPVLISRGSYEHAWLGITGRSMTMEVAEAMKLDPDLRGVLVIEVDPEGPAAKAGLKGSNDEATIYGDEIEIGGDVITKLAGQPVKEFENLATYLARYGEVGKTIPMTVLRDGKEVELSVTLMARPTTRTTQEVTATPRSTTTRSWLGITGFTMVAEVAEAMSLYRDTKGALVIEVSPDSPAAKAGLRGGSESFTYNGQEVKIGGDIITKFDDTVITSMNQMRSLIASTQPGTKVKLEILRDGKSQTVEVTLDAAPAQ
jgi:S1-C subfamily serine protease